MTSFVPKNKQGRSQFLPTGKDIKAQKTNAQADKSLVNQSDVSLQQNSSLANSKALPPQDLVVVARIGAAYGVKGWVKIHPFSHMPEAMLHATQWWVAPYVPEQSFDLIKWRLVEPLSLKPHSDTWVAQCKSWNDRTQAEQHKGWQVAIARADFPPADDDEYYWVDLLGAQVRNQDDVLLGCVVDLIENAAHTVLQIGTCPNSETNAIDSAHVTIEALNVLEQKKSKKLQTSVSTTQYLIPFVAAFVGHVDVTSHPKTIAVVWDVDATA